MRARRARAHRLDASTLLPTRPSVAPPTDPHDALTSGPGTSPLDRPSRRRCRKCLHCDRRFASVAARDAHAKRCVGVTDRGLKFGEPEDKQAARPAITGAESWAVAERTEHPRTRYLSDPDPAVAKILAGVDAAAAPRGVRVLRLGDAAARPSRATPRRAKENDAARKRAAP